MIMSDNRLPVGCEPLARHGIGIIPRFFDQEARVELLGQLRMLRGLEHSAQIQKEVEDAENRLGKGEKEVRIRAGGNQVFVLYAKPWNLGEANGVHIYIHRE